MRIRVRQLAVLLLAAVSLHAEVLDRVVASVNGKPILLSRVDEQARLAALLESRDPKLISAQDRAQALDRLINQMLVRDQIVRAAFSASAADVNARVQQVRAALGDSSDAAWKAALTRYSLDERIVDKYFRSEVDELQYVEARFRPTVKITPQQVNEFYEAEYLPKLRERGAREVALSEVRAQIEQVVTERAVTAAMAAWLQALRAQNVIHIWVTFTPEETATKS